MCKRIQESQVSVIYLDMHGNREVSYHAFLGYLLWAKTLIGSRRSDMIKSARQAYESYKVIKVRQDEDTEIFINPLLGEAA